MRFTVSVVKMIHHQAVTLLYGYKVFMLHSLSE